MSWLANLISLIHHRFRAKTAFHCDFWRDGYWFNFVLWTGAWSILRVLFARAQKESGTRRTSLCSTAATVPTSLGRPHCRPSWVRTWPDDSSLLPPPESQVTSYNKWLRVANESKTAVLSIGLIIFTLLAHHCNAIQIAMNKLRSKIWEWWCRFHFGGLLNLLEQLPSSDTWKF